MKSQIIATKPPFCKSSPEGMPTDDKVDIDGSNKCYLRMPAALGGGLVSVPYDKLGHLAEHTNVYYDQGLHAVGFRTSGDGSLFWSPNLWLGPPVIFS